MFNARIGEVITFFMGIMRYDFIIDRQNMSFL